MNLNSFKTDTCKEEQGITVSFGDAKITLASKSSDRYKKVMQRLLAPVETSIALNMLSENDGKAIALRGLAEGVIIGWDGFTEAQPDGDSATGSIDAPVPYSADKAFEYLRDIRVFRDFVEVECQKLDNFKVVKENTETKNS